MKHIGKICLLYLTAVTLLILISTPVDANLCPIQFGNLTIDQTRFTEAYYRNTAKVTDDELFAYQFPGVDSGVKATPSGKGAGFDLGLPTLIQLACQTEKETHTDFAATNDRLTITFPFIEVNPVPYPGWQPILPPFIP